MDMKKRLSLLLIICMLSGLFNSLSTVMASPMEGNISGDFIVKYYYATWGLTGKFQDAGRLATQKLTTNNIVLDGEGNVLKELSKEREDIRRMRIEAILTPTQSSNYKIIIKVKNTVGGEVEYETVTKGVKVYVDDQVITNYASQKSIMLSGDTDYNLDIEIYNNEVNNMYIFWEYTDGDNVVKEAIPINRLQSPSDNDKIAGIVKRDYTDQDSDNDGISNELETYGYTYLGGEIIPYDESLGTPKYVTDPNDASTDGDPYSDFAEVTGRGMDSSVLYPGNDPLVPAYPELRFVPQNIRIVKKIKSTTSRNISTSASYETTVIENYTNTIEESSTKVVNGSERIEVGTKVAVDTTEGSGSVGVSFKLDVNHGQDWTSQRASEAAVDKLALNKSYLSHAIEEGDSRYVNTDDYADVYISGYYENLGLAPAYNVKAEHNLNILKSNKTDPIISFIPEGGTLPPVIEPKSRFPEEGLLGIRYKKGSDFVADPISLTKDQVDYLEEGVPFTVQLSNITENEISPGGNQWSAVVDKINRLSADVELVLPNSRVIKRKIYAGNPDDSNGPKIKMDLYTALEKLFNAKKVTREGKTNLIILGEEIDDDLASSWSVVITGKSTDRRYTDLNTEIENGEITSFSDIILSPSMTVKVYKRSDDESIQNPEILQAYFDPNDNKIHAVVTPGQDGIKEVEGIKKVEAYYKTFNTENLVTLTQSTTNPLDYSSEVIFDLNDEYINRVVVTSSKNVEVEQEIIFNPAYLQSNRIHGYDYVNLRDRGFNQANRNLLRTYIDNNPSSDYFVVNLTEYAYADSAKEDQNKFAKLDIPVYMQVANRSKIINKVFRSPAGRITCTGDNLYYDEVDKSENYPEIVYRHANIVNGQVSITPSFKEHMYWHPGEGNTTAGKITVTRYDNRKDYLDIRTEVDRLPVRKANTHLSNVKVDYLFNTGISLGRVKHSQLAILPKQQVKEILTNPSLDTDKYRFQILGAYSTKSSIVFIPDNNPSFTTLGSAPSGDIIGLNQPNVDTVIMDILKDDEARLGINIGGQDINLDTTNIVGDNEGTNKHKHQELVYARTVNNVINYQSDKGTQYRIWGYLKDYEYLDEGEKYWQMGILNEDVSFNMINNMKDDVTTTQVYIPYDKLKIHQYPATPKAYMIKVDQLEMNAQHTKLTINNNIYHMDVGRKPIYDGFPKQYSHSGYIFVPVNEGNPYRLDIKLEQNVLTTADKAKPEHEREWLMKGLVNQGNVRFTVVGFYYESTKNSEIDKFLEQTKTLNYRYFISNRDDNKKIQHDTSLAGDYSYWEIEPGTGDSVRIQTNGRERLYADPNTADVEVIGREDSKYNDSQYRENFEWEFERAPAGVGYYYIKNKATNYYLDVADNQLIQRIGSGKHWNIEEEFHTKYHLETGVEISTSQDTTDVDYTDPEKIIDGIVGTEWTGSANKKHTLTLDFPKTFLMRHFKLFYSFRSTHKVFTSIDGEEWELLSTNNQTAYNLSIPKLTKHIKIEIDPDPYYGEYFLQKIKHVLIF